MKKKLILLMVMAFFVSVFVPDIKATTGGIGGISNEDNGEKYVYLLRSQYYNTLINWGNEYSGSNPHYNPNPDSSNEMPDDVEFQLHDIEIIKVKITVDKDSHSLSFDTVQGIGAGSATNRYGLSTTIDDDNFDISYCYKCVLNSDIDIDTFNDKIAYSMFKNADSNNLPVDNIINGQCTAYKFSANVKTFINDRYNNLKSLFRNIISRTAPTNNDRETDITEDDLYIIANRLYDENHGDFFRETRGSLILTTGYDTQHYTNIGQIEARGLQIAANIPLNTNINLILKSDNVRYIYFNNTQTEPITIGRNKSDYYSFYIDSQFRTTYGNGAISITEEDIDECQNNVYPQTVQVPVKNSSGTKLGEVVIKNDKREAKYPDLSTDEFKAPAYYMRKTDTPITVTTPLRVEDSPSITLNFVPIDYPVIFNFESKPYLAGEISGNTGFKINVNTTSLSIDKVKATDKYGYYTFDGWFMGDSIITSALSFANCKSIIDSKGQVEITGKFSPKRYTSKIVSDFCNNTSISYDISSETKLITPLITKAKEGLTLEETKAGYRFAGFTFDGTTIPVTEMGTNERDYFGGIIRANFEPITVNVTIGNKAFKAIYGEPLNITGLEKTGYTLKSISDGTTTYDADSISKFTEDVTLTANYEPIKVNVTVDDNETPIEIAYDSAINIPTPVKKGYEFKYFTCDGKRYNIGDKSDLLKDSEFVSVFEPIKVTLTLDGEDEVTATYDKALNLPTPQKTGFVFTGYTDGENIYNKGDISDFIEDTELTAVFVPASVTLTLDEDTKVKVEYGKELTFAEVTKVGYKFIGYTDGKNTYKTGDISKFTKDTILKAVFEPITVTITIDKEEKITATYDKKLELPIAKEKDGYEFTSYTDKDKNVYKTGDISKFTEDIELTTAYEPIKVTFTLEDGTKIETKYDAKLELPTPKKDGYTFKDFTDKDGNMYKNGDVVKVTKDIKLIANFTKNPVVIEKDKKTENITITENTTTPDNSRGDNSTPSASDNSRDGSAKTATTDKTTTKITKITLKKVLNLKFNNKKLSWKKVANAKKYQIKVSRNKKMTKASTYSTKKLYRLMKNDPGTYYVRVRAVRGYTAGKWSNIKKIVIK